MREQSAESPAALPAQQQAVEPEDVERGQQDDQAEQGEPPDSHETTEAAIPPDRLVWRNEPIQLVRRSISYRSWRDRQSHDLRISDVLRAEREWCAADESVAELGRAMNTDRPVALYLEVAQPPTEKELAWLSEVARITAETRGETLAELPEVMVMSHRDLRRLGCIPQFVEAWIASEEWLDRRNALATFEHLLTPLNTEFTPIDELGVWLPLIAGLFHPVSLDEQRITLIGDRPLSQQVVGTAAHEFAHALQDQRTMFGLARTYVEDTTDASLAFSWLVEGEATALSHVVMRGEDMRRLLDGFAWGNEIPVRRNPLFSNALRYGRLVRSNSVQSAYTGGSRLINQLREEGGWQAVDALFHDPPSTMEQILHSDKRAIGETPVELTDLTRLEQALAADWSAPFVDRLGELYVRQFLQDTLGPDDDVDSAAAGWGGDQLSVWTDRTDESNVLAAWQLVFDDERHHAEAWRAFRQWIVVHSEGEAHEAVGRPAVGWDGPAGAVRLVEQGESIWLIAAETIEEADKLALAILGFPATPYW